MCLFPKLSSCCKEAEDNLPTGGMSRPGGLATKCHQPSLLDSDINCIRGWWANSGRVEVHRKAHPEPSQGPWLQASEVCSLKTQRETLQEEVDQTRCDRVPVSPYIITCWPVYLKGPRPRHTCWSFHNEGLTLDNFIFKTLFDFTIFRDPGSSETLSSLLTKSCARTLPSCQGSTRPSW